MRKEDIKIGMKVVPHSKTTSTIFATWEQSEVIKEMEKLNQPYLYITHDYGDGEACLDTINTFNWKSGDIFKYSDFEPYEEETEEEYKSIADQNFIPLIRRRYEVRFNPKGKYNEASYESEKHIKGNVEAISTDRVILYDEEFGFNIIPFNSIVQMLEIK